MIFQTLYAERIFSRITILLDIIDFILSKFKLLFIIDNNSCKSKWFFHLTTKLRFLYWKCQIIIQTRIKIDYHSEVLPKNLVCLVENLSTASGPPLLTERKTVNNIFAPWQGSCPKLAQLAEDWGVITSCYRMTGMIW